jgi:hypothetical protein
VELCRGTDYRVEGRALSPGSAEEPEGVYERLTYRGQMVWGFAGGPEAATRNDIFWSRSEKRHLIFMPDKFIATELPAA